MGFPPSKCFPHHLGGLLHLTTKGMSTYPADVNIPIYTTNLPKKSQNFTNKKMYPKTNMANLKPLKPENGPSEKGDFIDSNHQFSGAFAVSFKEGKHKRSLLPVGPAGCFSRNKKIQEFRVWDEIMSDIYIHHKNPWMKHHHSPDAPCREYLPTFPLECGHFPPFM